MHSNKFMVLITLAALALAGESAAQSASPCGDFSGSWAGREGGGRVLVRISGGKVQGYQFNKKTFPITAQETSASSVSFKAGDGISVKMTCRKNGTVRYQYRDKGGYSASAVLRRS